MRLTHTVLFLATALLVAGCNKPAEPVATDPAANPPGAIPAPAAPATSEASPQTAPAGQATATLQPTQGNNVSGELTFTAADGGVHITGEVRGLTAGTPQGFHVHEKGDCSAPDGSSAGGHFNPGGSDHGRVGKGAHHGGDTDNLTADAQGVAKVDQRLEGVTLGDGSATDILGKGVIVHEKADDYTTQPTGDAGGRFACGVIEAVQ